MLTPQLTQIQKNLEEKVSSLTAQTGHHELLEELQLIDQHFGATIEALRNVRAILPQRDWEKAADVVPDSGLCPVCHKPW